jgi:hypothetical protein
LTSSNEDVAAVAAIVKSHYTASGAILFSGVLLEIFTSTMVLRFRRSVAGNEREIEMQVTRGIEERRSTEEQERQQRAQQRRADSIANYKKDVIRRVESAKGPSDLA